ncbi:MAG TPA: c-type cytochrome domain-containing protein [Verrucomicrobiae bacterium]
MIRFTTIAMAAVFGMAVAASAQDTNTPAASGGKLPPASTKTGVTYDTDIKPIFDAACVKCHNSAKKPGAGLVLDNLAGILKGGKNGKVITIGDSTKGDLIASVAHTGDDPMTFMPKGRNAKPLTPEEIGLIRAWIDQGAK